MEAGEHFGRYRIVRRLGQGGMGEVLLATDTVSGQQVALKLVHRQLSLDPSFTARFEREALALSKLNSPYVIGIFDAGTIDDVAYIATQFIAGGDLGAAMKVHGPLPIAVAADVVAQVCRGLDDAHRAGVIHRDVKPQNVLLRDAEASAPQVVLCDFGIALTGASIITATGDVTGSWSYLAPERVRGNPGDERADIYAAGCLLWSLLTGRPPYAGTDVQVAHSHLQGAIPQAPGDSEAVRQVNQVLWRALAKDPGARYGSAQEMGAVLEAIARRGDADLVSAVAQPAAERGRRRRWWMVAVPAVVALTVAGAGVAWWLEPNEGDKPAPEAKSSASPPASPTLKGGPKNIQSDLNADGRGDALIYGVEAPSSGPSATPSATTTTRSPALYLWRSGPQGLLGQPVPTPVGSTNVVSADFDQDGYLDTAKYYPGHDPSEVQEITIRSGLTGRDRKYQVPGMRMSDTTLARVVVGNFVGEKYPDFLIAAQEFGADGCRVWVLAGQQDGFDTTRAMGTLPRCKPKDTAIGDMDGDGRDELVTSRIDGSMRIQIETFALNQGAVKLTDSFAVEGSGRKPDGFAKASGESIAVGDVSGDGRDELVLLVARHSFATIGGKTTYGAQVLRGNRSGWEAPATWLTYQLPAEPFITRQDILLSDVDGDRKADLVVIGSNPTSQGGDDAFLTAHKSLGNAFAASRPAAQCRGCLESISYPVQSVAG